MSTNAYFRQLEANSPRRASQEEFVSRPFDTRANSAVSRFDDYMDNFYRPAPSGLLTVGKAIGHSAISAVPAAAAGLGTGLCVGDFRAMASGCKPAVVYSLASESCHQFRQNYAVGGLLVGALLAVSLTSLAISLPYHHPRTTVSLAAEKVWLVNCGILGGLGVGAGCGLFLQKVVNLSVGYDLLPPIAAKFGLGTALVAAVGGSAIGARDVIMFQKSAFGPPKID